MTTINCYLAFKDNCEEAFNFYKSVFGGEFAHVGKFKDMPPNEEFQITENDKEKIMHICLPINKETFLMGSDVADCGKNSFNLGNNFSVSVTTDSKEETTRIFNGLSEGGKITMPLDKTFWRAYFGMLTDKYGVQWMVNNATEEHK